MLPSVFTLFKIDGASQERKSNWFDLGHMSPFQHP